MKNQNYEINITDLKKNKGDSDNSDDLGSEEVCYLTFDSENEENITFNFSPKILNKNFDKEDEKDEKGIINELFINPDYEKRKRYSRNQKNRIKFLSGAQNL